MSSPRRRALRQYEDGTVVSVSYASFSEPRQLVATSTIFNSRIDEEPVTLTHVYEMVGR